MLIVTLIYLFLDYYSCIQLANLRMILLNPELLRLYDGGLVSTHLAEKLGWIIEEYQQLTFSKKYFQHGGSPYFQEKIKILEHRWLQRINFYPSEMEIE